MYCPTGYKVKILRRYQSAREIRSMFPSIGYKVACLALQKCRDDMNDAMVQLGEDRFIQSLERELQESDHQSANDSEGIAQRLLEIFAHVIVVYHSSEWQILLF